MANPSDDFKKRNRNPDSNLFRRLTRLFSGPIVNLRTQTYRKERRRQLDKYKFRSTSGQQFKKSVYDPFSNLTYNYVAAQGRAERYADFDQMEFMPEIASALDIYADEMTTSTFINELLTIDCKNFEIKQLLDDLYQNILNVEFNLFGWCRTMCKAGDFFLYLEIEDGKGVTNAIGLPTQEIERMEGQDPTNPNYIQFQWNSGGLTFENWQMAHFRILGNDKYVPYGTSVLEPARRIFRQLTLIEDAMMSYRIVRSPERRVFKVEVGNIPPQDVEQYVQRVMTQMKRNQVIDPDTGRVDLRYNPLSVEEDYFIPVRNGIGSDVSSLAGGAYTGDIDDVKYLREKLFAALKIPAAYLVAGEESEDHSALAQKDIRFARTIQRLQRSIVAELEKIGIIHLYTLGFKNKDLISFKLRLNNPSRIAELQELEYWRTKFDIAAAATEGFFSKRWIAEKIFSLSEADAIRNQREMYFDKIFAADLEKAAEEAAAEEGALEAGGDEAGLGLEGEDELGLEGEEDLGLGGEEDLGLGGEEAAGGGEEMLLAAPGKRDDMTTTPRSKGKWYKPVAKELDKRRHLAPKKKSMKKQFSDRLASTSRENVYPSLNALSRAGKGIYENLEANYSKEEIKILNSNEEINDLISQLENEDENK
jgi:hypothetical protein